jgi:hypothetical protein
MNVGQRQVAYHRRWAILAAGFQPPSKLSLRGFADVFNPLENVGWAQLEGGVPVGVHSATHLTYLVGPALERRNPAADIAGDYVVRR